MAKPVTLDLIVDKSRNRVRFAESDADFVDILLSFLTLPLGSILQLTKQSVGSLNNLLKSVDNLSSECFRSEACRSMLLCPSNTAANLFSSLPIKYNKIGSLTDFCYTCGCSNYSRLSFYPNTYCPCGGVMNKKLDFVGDASYSNAKCSSFFFNGTFRFTITDDLLISQSSVDFAIEEFSKLGIKQASCLESVKVDVTVEKIIVLLKRLLVSDTPLTDVFLGGFKEEDKLQVIQQSLRANCKETEAQGASTRKIAMKLYVNKDEDTVIIAEVDNNFVDLLFGFLTYPMGSAISKLGKQSGIRCMDNLYKSVEALKPTNCFWHNELIGMLINPKLPQYFKVMNQLIQLDEVIQTNCYYICSVQNCYRSCCFNSNCSACKQCGDRKFRQLTHTDSKRGTSTNDHITGGYMRISRYMVTDDLVVRQPSSFMVISDILREVAGKEIHAMNVEIGEHEALALLRASITSENVLTDALLGVERGKRCCKSF